MYLCEIEEIKYLCVLRMCMCVLRMCMYVCVFYVCVSCVCYVCASCVTYMRVTYVVDCYLFFKKNVFLLPCLHHCFILFDVFAEGGRSVMFNTKTTVSFQLIK